MKKLMFAAVVGLCGTVFADGESIESANIVGYQLAPVIYGYNFATITFQNVAGGEYKLNDLVPKQSDGSDFGTGKKTKFDGGCYIRKISASGAYGTEYTYYWTSEQTGWYQGDTKVGDDVTFKNGEGMIIKNEWKEDTPIAFRMSGSVNLAPSTVFQYGYSFGGNFTPSALNLQKDFTILQESGEQFGTGKKTKFDGGCYIRKISASGAYGTEYTYYWTSERTGWYQGDEKVPETGTGSVTFEPGEGFIIKNEWKEDTPIMLTLTAPTTK